LEANTKRLKQYAEQSMQDAGMKKSKGALFTFSIQKNPAALNIVDESIIPEIFFTIPQPVLDTAIIKEQLKLGFEIPGAQLTQGESLRIK
jgi:hypothetical protein